MKIDSDKSERDKKWCTCRAMTYALLAIFIACSLVIDANGSLFGMRPRVTGMVLFAIIVLAITFFILAVIHKTKW